MFITLIFQCPQSIPSPLQVYKQQIKFRWEIVSGLRLPYYWTGDTCGGFPKHLQVKISGPQLENCIKPDIQFYRIFHRIFSQISVQREVLGTYKPTSRGKVPADVLENSDNNTATTGSWDTTCLGHLCLGLANIGGDV